MRLSSLGIVHWQKQTSNSFMANLWYHPLEWYHHSIFNKWVVKVTLRTFARENIDLPMENLPELTQGKFISGFIFPRWKGHTEENHI